MSTNYMEIPERLRAYRKALALNQEEMGERLGVGQDHYSKLENGNNIISYNSLISFEKSGGDIYFLITGKESQVGIMDTYLAQCKTTEGKIDALKVILWASKQGILWMNTDRFCELESVWKYVKLAEKSPKSPSIWKNIRELEKLSQVQMADCLDINIKRYQRMENMQTKPDAEILNTLFKEFGYSPLVVLEIIAFPLDGINRVWNEFSEDIKDPLLEIVEKSVKIIERYETR